MTSGDSQPNYTEIVIVGAGLAGAAAAAVLGEQGRSVVLVDPRPEYPPVFKAEKIEPDQAHLLRKLGLLKLLLPKASRVREVLSGYNGRVFKSVPIEQYGMTYSAMVNALRKSSSADVVRKVGRVERIESSSELQRVRLAGGEELTCRLVMLACGVNGELQAGLGLHRRWFQKEQSLAFGFTIASTDGQAFPFEAVTYYPTSCAAGVDYLSLFPIGQTMRANLFAFRPSADPWVRQFMQEPRLMLDRCFPKLRRVIGEFDVGSKVECARIDLYQMGGNPKPGVVLIGDALQNVCPSTGMGLSRIFTDVDVLCSECVPQWFATPGMGADKTAAFYEHPRKRAIDSRAIENAQYRRRACLDRSLRWRVHRILRLYLPRQFGRPSPLAAPEIRGFAAG